MKKYTQALIVCWESKIDINQKVSVSESGSQKSLKLQKRQILLRQKLRKTREKNLHTFRNIAHLLGQKNTLPL